MEGVRCQRNCGMEIGPGLLLRHQNSATASGTNRAGPDDPRDQIRSGDAGNNRRAAQIHWGDADSRDPSTFANAEFPISTGNDDFYYVWRVQPASGRRRRQFSARQSMPPTGRRSIRWDFFRSSNRSSSMAPPPADYAAFHRDGSGTPAPSTGTTASTSTSRIASTFRSGPPVHPDGVLRGHDGVRPVRHDFDVEPTGRGRVWRGR